MRASKSVRWANAPVYLMLVDLRFSPVQAMARYVDEIQEGFRQTGFPEFKRGDITSIFFGEKDGEDPKIQRDDRWVFADTNNASQFVLTTSSLVFQTTDYLDHTHLFSQSRIGVEILQQTVKPASLHRVGMRYLDAVWPGSGRDLSDYLNPALLGVDLGRPTVSSFTESSYSIGSAPQDSTLILKVFKADSNLRLPPDLGALELTLADRFNFPEPQWHGVLDIDHFTEKIQKFDVKVVSQSLGNLHSEVSSTFHACTTEFAREQWEKGDTS